MKTLLSFILGFVLVASVSAKANYYEGSALVSEKEKVASEKKSDDVKGSDDAILIDVKRDILEKDIMVEYSPVNKDLNLSVASSLKGGKVTVFNAAGEVVFKSKLAINSTKRVSTNNWNKGIYFVEFTSSQGASKIKKVICY